jgi:hypothetical protein
MQEQKGGEKGESNSFQVLGLEEIPSSSQNSS